MDIIPIGFSDSSFSDDPDDAKSTSDYAFLIANRCISFGSHKQTTVALSSMEAEYMALTDAAKEAIFLHRLLTSLKFDVTDPFLIQTDSDSALKHVKNNINHPRTKHINRRHHYIREVYVNDEVNIEHVPAAEQTADILTKALSTVLHARTVKLLNLQVFTISTST